MKYKNLISTIAGIITIALGIFCFFYIPSFGVLKFIVSEILGTVMMRLWISKKIGLSLVERFIK